jgi:uncharacterized protein
VLEGVADQHCRYRKQPEEGEAAHAAALELFFWRDRTREVDFVVDIGGRLELFEAKWTELPAASDAVNLDFVRNVVGKSRIASSAIICRTPNSFPIADGLRALPITELG